MADLRLQQQARIRDVRGHELGVFALDRLVVVGVDDPNRYGDALQIRRGPVRLGLPHLGDLSEERLVLAGGRRQFFVFPLRPGDKGVEHRAVGDVGDAARI